MADLDAGRSLVIASGNPGKLRELESMFAPLGWSVRPQSDWQVPEAVEDGLSFVENALIKARNASAVTGLPALADDSGLVVDCLDGAPGIYSARYAGPDANDQANNRKLLDSLAGVPADQRAASFYCAAVIVMHENDPTPLIAVGRWSGHILEHPSGTGGFGYDPLFQVPGPGCSSADLSPQEKNRLSHRGQALRKLVQLLDGV